MATPETDDRAPGRFARLLARGRRFYHVASPNLLLAGAFAATILAGGLLLRLPWARTGAETVGWLDAFFTSASAVCVTGFTVVDTPTAFTPFGHVVILVLIELGGIGVMTFAAVGFWFIGRRLSLTHQAALDDSLFQQDAGRRMRRATRRVAKLVLTIQGVGALALWACLIPTHLADGRGVGFALWSAVFHAVSAFCNSGFSLYTDNLAGPERSLPLLVVVAALVVLGGLGHWVLAELVDAARRLKAGAGPGYGVRWFSLHTRVVLWVSAGLMAAGGVALLAFGTASGAHSFVDALFLSTSGRTAGFNSCAMDRLPLPSILTLTMLMFVGGSPGSCAGGIKTTGLAIWFGRLRASLRSDPNVSLFGFEIPPELLWKARMLTGLATLWIAAGTLFLSVTENASLDMILFEQTSAFATTGLSLGLTPLLSDAGRVWMILSMYVGRVGPLTIVFWMAHENVSAVRRPYGRVMVG